ncbi:MAG: DUF5688 family protein [Solobacterium sp.]|nr:DUF5688 family protein [Solobacterium sp.]
MKEITFEEFREEVLAEAGRQLPGEYRDCRIVVHRFRKLNGVYDGAALLRSDEEWACGGTVADLEEAYRTFREHGDLIRSAKEIVQTVTRQAPAFQMPDMDSYEEIRKHLFIRLGSRAKNRELLQKVPYRQIGDMALTYHIRIDCDVKGVVSTIVTNDLLERLGVSVEELDEDACAGGARMFPAVVSMTPAGNRKAKIFTLTNTIETNGASALFYPGMMHIMTQILPEGFFVLPVSVNQVLIASGMEMGLKELERCQKIMVSQLDDPREFLSETPYYYDPEKDSLITAEQHFHDINVQCA